MLDRSEIPSEQSYKDRLTNFSNEFDLGLFIYILKKSLVWVLLCLVVAAFGAFLYLRYTPFIYSVKSVIQLAEDDNANKILKVETQEDLNKPEAKVELLRSKLLISRTLEHLDMKVSYFAKGQILTSEHYSSSPYKIELIRVSNAASQDIPIPISFSTPGEFSIVYNGKQIDHCVVGQATDAGDFSFILTVSDWERLAKNQEEYQLYFIINGITSLTQRFYDNLEIRILNSTARTLEITYRDNNPYLARDFVRAHSNEFLKFDLEKRRRSDDNVLSFLDDQIDTVYFRLKESEVNLNNYKQNNKINDLESVSDSYLSQITDFDNEVLAIKVEEKILDEAAVLTKKSRSELDLSNLIPIIAGSRYENSLEKLVARLQELIIAREEALYSVTTDNDRVKSLDYNIDVQKNLILQTISGLRDQLRERDRSLTEKMAQTENKYYNIPQKELEYSRLKRLFNINEKYYTLLLEKSIEYKISKEGFVSNNQILEEARTPVSPIAPKRNMVIVTFILSGLLLGFVIIAVRYLIHNKITSLNEIVKLSHATINNLGIIPRYKEDIPVSMLIIDKNPRSIIAESFRSIRTNLQFLNNKEGSKVIAVTSTVSGEGKTFVALNLAGILAFGDKKVIVVDLDMRKPKIHKGFAVENRIGMSTLLIGKSNISETIRNSSLDNLDYITAGPIPPNPAELVISHQMDEIIEKLKTMYDYVVLDTPPVGLVTDAVALLQKADYPIYIFRADYSKKQFVQVADKLINENRINVSAILNGVDMDRNKYSYSYGYGYGYGYGTGSGGYYDTSAVVKKKQGWFGLFRKMK